MVKGIASKRPWGITLLVVFLTWLSMAAFISLFAFNSHTILNKILILFYGSAALITACSLWKLKEWAILAYLTWSISVAATAIYFQLTTYNTSLIKMLVMNVVIGFILYVGYKYISKKITLVTMQGK